MVYREKFAEGGGKKGGGGGEVANSCVLLLICAGRPGSGNYPIHGIKSFKNLDKPVGELDFQRKNC